MDFSKHLSSLVDIANEIHEEDFKAEEAEILASEEKSKLQNSNELKLIKELAEIEADTLQNNARIESEEKLKLASLELDKRYSLEREHLFSTVSKAIESQADNITKCSETTASVLAEALSKLTDAISKNSQPKSCLVSIIRDENGDANSMVIKQGINAQ